MPSVMHQPCAAATIGFVHVPSSRHGSRPSSGNGSSPLDDVRSDVHQVEAGGEVVAVCEEDTRTQGVVGLQQPVGAGQVGEYRQVECVALVGPVETDGKHVAIAFQCDGGQRQLRCCHQPSEARCGRLCNTP